MRSSIFLPFICLIILSACKPNSAELARAVSASETAEAGLWTAAPSATVVVSPTASPTAAQVPTSTRTERPTNTPRPTATLDPTRHYSSNGRYSLVLPIGWEAEENGNPFSAFYGPESDGYQPNIRIMEETSEWPMEFYAAIVQDSITAEFQELTQISESFLETSTGHTLFRWEFTVTNGQAPLHRILYMLNSGENILLLIYSRLPNQPVELDTAVDAAMDTIIYNPD